jgi:release factor glutamine methyltransferase
VLAHPEAQLDSDELSRLGRAVEMVERGKPLPYILGSWEFFGFELIVTPDVLIPRPETEMLIEAGIEWLHSHPGRRLAVDLGTGSGCIAVALAMHIRDLQILATDISRPALDVATANIARFGLSSRVSLLQADLLEPFEGRFDLICGNLPYIPSETLKTLPVSAYESNLALDGGPDGLSLIRRALVYAQANIRPGGLLLFEIEASQGEEVVRIARRIFTDSDVRLTKDLARFDRLLSVQTPGFEDPEGPLN